MDQSETVLNDELLVQKNWSEDTFHAIIRLRLIRPHIFGVKKGLKFR